MGKFVAWKAWQARAALSQPAKEQEPRKCSDGGLCGVGGYCDTCPNIAGPVQQEAKPEQDAILTGLKKAVEAAKEDGMWRPCSGCYETEDGHAVGRYPFSDALGCSLGSGCGECGGLGAIWEDFSGYEDLAEDEDAAPVQAEVKPEPCADCGYERGHMIHTEFGTHAFVAPQAEAKQVGTLAHTRIPGMSPIGDVISQAEAQSKEAVVLKPCDCTQERRRNCDYCAGYGKEGGEAWPANKPWPMEAQPDGTVTPVDPADMSGGEK